MEGGEETLKEEEDGWERLRRGRKERRRRNERPTNSDKSHIYYRKLSIAENAVQLIKRGILP